MTFNKKILTEAIVVGIVFTIVATAISKIVPLFVAKVDLPPVCKEWNQFYVMEITLFLSGVAGHLLFEIFGANKWYCTNGAACME